MSLGFISMIIIIYGRDKLMKYLWYRKVVEFIATQKQYIVGHPSYIKLRNALNELRQKLKAFTNIFKSNKKKIFIILKRYIRVNTFKYKRERQEKRQDWKTCLFLNI